MVDALTRAQRGCNCGPEAAINAVERLTGQALPDEQRKQVLREAVLQQAKSFKRLHDNAKTQFTKLLGVSPKHGGSNKSLCKIAQAGKAWRNLQPGWIPKQNTRAHFPNTIKKHGFNVPARTSDIADAAHFGNLWLGQIEDEKWARKQFSKKGPSMLLRDYVEAEFIYDLIKQSKPLQPLLSDKCPQKLNPNLSFLDNWTIQDQKQLQNDGLETDDTSLSVQSVQNLERFKSRKSNRHISIVHDKYAGGHFYCAGVELTNGKKAQINVNDSLQNKAEATYPNSLATLKRCLGIKDLISQEKPE